LFFISLQGFRSLPIVHRTERSARVISRGQESVVLALLVRAGKSCSQSLDIHCRSLLPTFFLRSHLFTHLLICLSACFLFTYLLFTCI
jgi:hypothetical protein